MSTQFDILKNQILLCIDEDYIKNKISSIYSTEELIDFIKDTYSKTQIITLQERLNKEFERTKDFNINIQNQFSILPDFEPLEDPDVTENVFLLVVQLFEGNEIKAKDWLERPNKAFSGISPRERIKTSGGVEAVKELIGQIEHGIIS